MNTDQAKRPHGAWCMELHDHDPAVHALGVIGEAVLQGMQEQLPDMMRSGMDFWSILHNAVMVAWCDGATAMKYAPTWANRLRVSSAEKLPVAEERRRVQKRIEVLAVPDWKKKRRQRR